MLCLGLDPSIEGEEGETDCLWKEEPTGIWIKNHCIRAEDVLQIYVKVLDSKFAVPNYSLCAMQPFTLRSGEAMQLTLTVNKGKLMTVDADGNRKPDTRSMELTGKQPIAFYVQRMVSGYHNGRMDKK